MDELEKAIELSKQTFEKEENQRKKTQSIEEIQRLIRTSPDGIHYIKRVSFSCPIQVQSVQHTFYFSKVAQTVDIAGTFNGWSKEPMKYSVKNQCWYKKMRLWPVSYQYKFVINGGQWEYDRTKPTKPDVSGNINNYICFGENEDLFHQYFDAYLTGIGHEVGSFNYDPDFTQLLVRHTLGDGNCLCNAATLAIWHVNDTNQIIRLCLRHTLASLKSTLYPYFESEFIRNSKRLFGSDFEASQKEILIEWQSEEECLATQSRYLSSFHTFLLSNVIRRPIILYADKSSMLQGLGGIYFPWLWIEKLEDEKFKNPLAILYYENHYSLVVPTEPEGYYPIVNEEGNLLPVRFIPPNLKNKDTRDILKRLTNLKNFQDKTWGIHFSFDLGSEDWDQSE